MRRSLSLGAQLLVLQVAIVLLTVSVAGLLAVRLQEEQIRTAYTDRVLSVADSVASLPSIREAYGQPDPASIIQPIAETIREATGATFVVVTDDKGLRYSHPNPARLGQRVSTDPGPALAGQRVVVTETGTLGRSVRAKVPIRGPDGEIIGIVSVGILEERLAADLRDDLPETIVMLAGAALLGVLGAAAVTRWIRRRLFGLEPEEIARLLEAREGTLHGIREGVLAVDSQGRISLVNDEATRLLGFAEDVTGQPIATALESEADLLSVLRSDDEVVDSTVLVGERVLVVNRMTTTVRGRRAGTVTTLRDRTELDEALRELHGARNLAEALRAQAHEYSNRMHVLTGLLELGRTTEAIRFLTGHTGGVGSAGPQPPDVDDPEMSALLLAKSAIARERGIALRIDPTSHVPLLDNALDLLTVLGNLIDNAMDATSAGGRVDVLVQADSRGATLRVGDDGPGVPVPDRERIFTAGYSTKHPPGTRSRGIGLALVARVVARRHGSVHVLDAPGGGAEFVVTVPAPDLAAAAP